jgi:hypothetical protein
VIYQIKTESGSVYRIDTDDKTWERIETGPYSGRLRSASGPYLFCDAMQVGSEGIKLTCPPVNPSTSFRFIYTSPVVEVKVCN